MAFDSAMSVSMLARMVVSKSNKLTESAGYRICRGSGERRELSALCRTWCKGIRGKRMERAEAVRPRPWLGQGRLRSADVGTSIRPSLICIGDVQDSNLLSPDLLPRGPRHLPVLWNHVQRFEHGARLYASQGTEDNAAGRWPHRFRRLGPAVTGPQVHSFKTETRVGRPN